MPGGPIGGRSVFYGTRQTAQQERRYCKWKGRSKLTFLADTHYYSKSLGVSGRQYELRSGSDQKCLAETEEIITAAFEEIGNSDTDAVMIAGDLTNDGERVCHEEFRKLARGLAQKKPLYLITATHDWCCDGNPRRYDGDMVFHDVPTLSSESLYDFYRDFGPKQAISVFQTHLGTASYVIALSGSVWLLALIDRSKRQKAVPVFSKNIFCGLRSSSAARKNRAFW